MQGDYTSPWPYVGTPHGRAYRITFTAGYGTAAEIPSPIKKAITDARWPLVQSA